MPDTPAPPPDDADEPEFDGYQPDDETPDDDEAEEDSVLDAVGGTQRAVFVSTALPIQVTVAPLDDERAPDGTALGTYIGERLVARCAMPMEAIDRLLELDLFGGPVPLALLAVEEEPGLQCRLFALVPADRLTDAEDSDEPWRASVPSYEETLADDDEEDDDDDEDEDEDGDEDDDDTAVASILLGHIVRFEKDRKFTGDLTAEAVDVLQRIVLGGPLQDANSKAVDDLLDSL